MSRYIEFLKSKNVMENKDLRQVGGFLRFPLPTKLTTTI